MNTANLASLLRDATDDLEPRAGFTNAVVRGGRRRQIRSRIAVATTITAAVALVGGTSYAIVATNKATNSDIMAGWLQSDTLGPLATNQQFLDKAVVAWEAGKTRSPNASAGIFDDVRDDPHVYWAGNTPAGRAAIVMQQAYLHPHDQLPSGAADTLQTLVGLVAIDPVDDTLKLVGDQFQARPTDPVPGSFLFGEESSVLLVVDRGQPVWERRHIALGLLPGQEPTEEHLRSQWEGVPVSDGVAIERFDKGLLESVVSAPDPIARSVRKLPLLQTDTYVIAAATGGTGPLDADGTNRLNWPNGDMRVGGSGGPVIRSTLDTYMATSTSVEVNRGDYPRILNYQRWFVRALLPDGRVAVLGAYTPGGEPLQVGVVLVSPDMGISRMLLGDVINRNVPLPVRYHLPDGQGWLVAAHGKTLSYRTNGDWQAAGRDAALLPHHATQVKVDDTVVDLPR